MEIYIVTGFRQNPWRGSTLGAPLQLYNIIHVSNPPFVRVPQYQSAHQKYSKNAHAVRQAASIFNYGAHVEKEMGLTFHRVYVGTFLKKIDAEKAAVKIKESEKIESLVKYYKKS